MEKSNFSMFLDFYLSDLSGFKDIFTDFNLGITSLLVFFFLFLVYMVSNLIKDYRVSHTQKIKENCKSFQLFCEKNQTIIFVVTNIIVFLCLSCLFDPVSCLITHMAIIDLVGLFYLFELYAVPVVPILIYTGITLRWTTASDSVDDVTIALGLLVLSICTMLDSMDLLKPFKDFFAKFQEELLKNVYHKKTEFFWFAIIEKLYVSVLILMVGIPTYAYKWDMYSDFTLNYAQEQALANLYMYVYSFMAVVMVVNFIIINVCNPGPDGKIVTLANCLNCAVATVAIGAAYQVEQRNLHDLATGGIREPGTSDRVGSVQIATFGATCPTAHGVRQIKVFREVIVGPIPVHPGSQMANSAEIARIMLEDTDDRQKRHIDLLNGKRQSLTAWALLPAPTTEKPPVMKAPFHQKKYGGTG
jgi:hypothetical protein